MQTFLAMITLMDSGAHPDQGLPGQPPGIWPSPGHPAHPIAPGGRPPGIWGGPPLYPDQGLPGSQPHPSHPIVIPPGALGPGQPTHPIYIPPIASTGPGFPTQPIYIPPGAIAPGVPTHPIVIPPDQLPHPSHPIAPGGAPPRPDQGLPGAPPQPTHPIVIPPVPPTEASDKALVLVVTADAEPVWFVIDKNDGLKPTHPQPKK
jgi:hypothetical protein